MNVNIRVEGFSPVPLQPLSDILIPKRKMVVYIEHLVATEEGDCEIPSGWFVYANGEFNRVSGDDFWENLIDLKRSNGRLLQPGEKLVVEFTQE